MTELSQLLTNNNNNDDKIAFQLKADLLQIHFCLGDTDVHLPTFIHKTDNYSEEVLAYQK